MFSPPLSSLPTCSLPMPPRSITTPAMLMPVKLPRRRRANSAHPTSAVTSHPWSLSPRPSTMPPLAGDVDRWVRPRSREDEEEGEAEAEAEAEVGEEAKKEGEAEGAEGENDDPGEAARGLPSLVWYLRFGPVSR